MASSRQEAKRARAAPRKRRSESPPTSVRSVATQHRVARVLTDMRKGRSLTESATRAGTTVRTVRKYACHALRRRARIYEALPRDEVRRRMRVPTDQGVAVADIRSSRTASRLSKYWSAVDHYLRTGDQRRLRPFVGKRVRAGGHLFLFVTDPELLSRLAEVGEVRFEDLYATTV